MGKLRYWLPTLLLAILVLMLPRPARALPITSCVTNPNEPHPLRPYPGEICGPEAARTIDQTDTPYCAMRPWAVGNIEYLRNQQDCPAGDPIFPCIIRTLSGIYSIDLTEYELPLVSVNRPGFESLTFFNRAQEHLADYLEGRTYYEGVAEPEPSNSPIDWIPVWNRIGVLRKLTSTLPKHEGNMIQDALKIQMIEGAGVSHHNYIVGYISGGEPADWGTGTPIRLRDFIGNFPPEYICNTIADPVARKLCNEAWQADFNIWKETIYGKLWPYVPLVTREDAKGFVRVFPEPGQPFTTQTAPVSIPHLPRLHAVSGMLQQMLESNLIEEEPAEEAGPYEGVACPAGPWWTSGTYGACGSTSFCQVGACSDPGSMPSLSGGSGSCRVNCSSLAGNSVPPLMRDIIGTAGQEYGVPGALIIAIMFAEGGFERQSCYGGAWSNALVEESSACGGQVPNCCNCNVSSSGARGTFQWIPRWFEAYRDAAQAVDPSRAGDPCNFLDAAFATAKKLSLEHGGAASYSPPSCDGITYNTLAPRKTSCGDWNSQDIATATRQYVGACNVDYQQNVFSAYDKCK
ncbi:hypothetical protein IH980_02730 [Patescibacteria group bacterium]|nr:hypothetical protein [Patescibacteria group bacterium]